MSRILMLLLFPIISFSQQKYQYKNLVLEGGGVRGLAYAGAFNELENKGVLQQIEKVAGTSAGAIAGLMISIGYTVKEIDSIMYSLPVEEFNDGGGGIVGKYVRAKNKYGLYEGKIFERWLRKLIKYKTGIEDLTFTSLHQLHLENNIYKDFYCTGTNLTRQQLDIFSFEHTPHMSVVLAVRISAGIPLYFEPVILDDDYKKISVSDTISTRNYYVDGGMIANYPINIFDSCESSGNPLQCDRLHFNTQTLGIKLERPAQIDSLKNNSNNIPPYKINSFKDYLYAFNNLLIETLNRKYPNLENEKFRTIYVSVGSVQPRVRKMKADEKKMLYNNGVKAVTEFFDNRE